MSYQEYEHLSQSLPETGEATPAGLTAPALTLEQTFGAMTPLNRPEDFKALRDSAIEELAQRTVDKTSKLKFALQVLFSREKDYVRY